jgi:hypothetical protein
VNLDGFNWDGRELTAHSPTLGDLRLPADAVNDLIYHPAPARPPAAVTTKKLVKKDSGDNSPGPEILR